MPVRSRGSLLAGTAALAGLMVAGLGCHSSYSDHDSFSIPKASGQSSGTPLVRRDGPTKQAGYVAQPVIPPDRTVSFRPNARSLALQPVPIVQSAASKREVIASSWSPVQRVSAEQPVQVPDVRGGMPGVPVSVPQTARPAAFTPGARMPMGAPMPAGGSPLLDSGDVGTPSNIVLPPPRPLGPLAPSVVVHDGGMPARHPTPYPDVPREFEKMALPSYVVEPPDILLIQASNRITLRLQPLQGQHLVGPDGTVNLGIYGKVRVAGLTVEQVADVVAARLLEIMPGMLRGIPVKKNAEDPIPMKEGKEEPKKDDSKAGKEGTDDSIIDSEKLWKLEGFTSVDLVKKELQVDVLTYSSKFYYVITDGGGYGQQVYPIPIRGNETVLDALANVNGLPPVSSKRKVWVARATRAGQPPKILPVDWLAVAKCGSAATNYQIFPGDRVYVDSNVLIKADSFLAKLYSPILRTFGITLLGTATVNSIKSGSSGGAGGLGLIR